MTTLLYSALYFHFCFLYFLLFYTQSQAHASSILPGLSTPLNALGSFKDNQHSLLKTELKVSKASDIFLDHKYTDHGANFATYARSIQSTQGKWSSSDRKRDTLSFHAQASDTQRLKRTRNDETLLQSSLVLARSNPSIGSKDVEHAAKMLSKTLRTSITEKLEGIQEFYLPNPAQAESRALETAHVDREGIIVPHCSAWKDYMGWLNRIVRLPVHDYMVEVRKHNARILNVNSGGPKTLRLQHRYRTVKGTGVGGAFAKSELEQRELLKRNDNLRRGIYERFKRLQDGARNFRGVESGHGFVAASSQGKHKVMEGDIEGSSQQSEADEDEAAQKGQDKKESSKNKKNKNNKKNKKKKKKGKRGK